MNDKIILDACCGSKMFWYNKNNASAIYQDLRRETLECCDGRKVIIDPDVIGDFRNMEFKDASFKVVIFDPPHDMYGGANSFTTQKYGKLNKENWRDDLKKGFDECIRVLEPFGVLIFKWNEMRVSTSEIIRIIGREPLIGHKSGKASKTHWLLYIKGL